MSYYNEIKTELINNEIYKKVKDYSKNRSDLTTYYNVGKLIIEAQGGEARAKYGDGLIKEYSKKLMIELDKKYSYRNLMYMRKFYLIFKTKKLNTLCSQLSWSHYRLLLIFNDIDVIIYYLRICLLYNLSVRDLSVKIKNKEYERLDESVREKITTNKENKIQDFIKNPILIKNSYNYTQISEKILKQLILEDLDNFMKELGEGFCYVENEYKIKLGTTYNYLDLLLFNIKYNCYVVVELKITELKKEHIGQISTYMNYIDKHIKTINQDSTIGIIVCAKDNKILLEYCSDSRIYETEFVIN